MAITRIRGSAQIAAGTVNANNVLDRSLIPSDFSVWPLVPQNMTTAERDLLHNIIIGLTIFNTDTGSLEFWNGTEWISTNPAAKMVADENGDPVLDNDGNPIYVI